MRILIVADPLEAILPASDTSLDIVCAARDRGHDVAWASGEQLYQDRHQTCVRAQQISACPPKALPVLRALEPAPITAFDAVVVRKNPPFDESYQRLCWLLLPHEHEVVISNPVSRLLHLHEKMVPRMAVAAGFLRPEELIPTCVTDQAEIARAFVELHGGETWIVKPWLGYAGHDVRKVCGADAVTTIVASSGKPWLVQPFLPEVVSEGDRRVFFVHGEIAGDIVRLPREGDFISNLAYGGRGELRPMSASTADRCRRLGEYLRSVDIDFAGADVIGDIISEVNVTSPTGIVAFKALGGHAVAPMIVQCIEERVHARG